jgi:hypothetical protein
MGTGGSFPGGKSGLGVLLTTHPLLAVRLGKDESYIPPVTQKRLYVE